MPGFQKQKIDAILAKDQLEAMQAMRVAWGDRHFCAAMFWILVKQATNIPGVTSARIVPFTWNWVQAHLFERLAANNRILKARQAGFTTFCLLVRLLLPIITDGGKSGMLVSQNSKYATQHFLIARRAYRLIGALDPYNNELNSFSASLKANVLHTEYSNRKEIYFDYLDSKLIVESAEVEEAGQGVTLQHVVCSEVARWPGNPEATMSNILGSITPGGTRDEESTGNGAAGYFYEQYLASMNDEVAADARPHFYGWWWSEDYKTETLTPAEAAELEADLTSDELAIIRKIHLEMQDVSYPAIAA